MPEEYFLGTGCFSRFTTERVVDERFAFPSTGRPHSALDGPIPTEAHSDRVPHGHDGQGPRLAHILAGPAAPESGRREWRLGNAISNPNTP
jgi:hypothetical protein